MNQHVIAWAPAVIWMAGIAWASLSPPPPVPDGAGLWLHVVAYGILTILLRRAVADRGRTRRTLAAAIVACAYGIGLEGLQATLSYRTAEAGDILANAIGVAAAAFIPIHRRSEVDVP